MNRDAFDDPTFQVDDQSRDGEQRDQRRGRGCFTLTGCVLGCGGLVVIGVILTTVLVYLAYNVLVNGTSDDPAQLRVWLNEVVDCEIPPGYEPVVGFSAEIPLFHVHPTFMLIVPDGLKLDADEEKDATAFIIVALEGAAEEMLKAQAQQAQAQMGQGAGQGGQGIPEKEEQVEVEVGGRKTSATRITSETDGQMQLQYQVMIKPGVLLIATGPEEGFDQAAFDAFLASVKREGDVEPVDLQDGDQQDPAANKAEAKQ